MFLRNSFFAKPITFFPELRPQVPTLVHQVFLCSEFEFSISIFKYHHRYVGCFDFCHCFRIFSFSSTIIHFSLLRLNIRIGPSKHDLFSFAIMTRPVGLCWPIPAAAELSTRSMGLYFFLNWI
ncbi:hypothetical protein V8G54_018659 [Vigna mungo]|uniref:Uncharacterized protein n=1 Tax=Vigna mungo TaxID=3915 RepID=A0AAQ3RU60_VIGMU